MISGSTGKECWKELDSKPLEVLPSMMRYQHNSWKGTWAVKSFLGFWEGSVQVPGQVCVFARETALFFTMIHHNLESMISFGLSISVWKYSNGEEDIPGLLDCP